MTAGAVDIRHAGPAERAALAALLAECGLPLAGTEDPQCALWAAAADGELVGVAGLERYGEVGLVRSVAVRAAWRDRGVASALTRQVLTAAAAAGVTRLYLLTETAESFFRGLGFATVPRAAADPRLMGSAEFQGGHCASAVLMTRALP